jgi:hypothetical protein
MKRKPRSPYFVSAELLRDGTVKMLTDDGDEYHVQMRAENWEPLVSRRLRRREMFDMAVKESEPTPPFGAPRLVK